MGRGGWRLLRGEGGGWLGVLVFALRLRLVGGAVALWGSGKVAGTWVTASDLDLDERGASVAGLSLGALSFPLPASSSVNVGMAGLSLDPSPSYSSSSSLDVAVGGPALLFAGSGLPVHADGRADWYLYAITETETSSTPSANSTIVRPRQRQSIFISISTENYHGKNLLCNAVETKLSGTRAATDVWISG